MTEENNSNQPTKNTFDKLKKQQSESVISGAVDFDDMMDDYDYTEDEDEYSDGGSHSGATISKPL